MQRTRPERIPVEAPSSISIIDIPSDLCVRSLLSQFEGPIRSAVILKARPGKEATIADIKFHDEADAKKHWKKDRPSPRHGLRN
eukprot:gnl/Chilomastix_caulleri/8563.p2 GENE.gnl/Chilomastix_caulleri/8563~~gnl/Chilomastix_caulleri/8563.p2  ORF type:complete len:97 (+),score=25.53 gnl/Chilomastix_caulleri/8563:42-293(+)